jgi:hypothetical protein
MAGARAQLCNGENIIVIRTISGNSPWNTLKPMTRENQPVIDASIPSSNMTPANKTATGTMGGRCIWICLFVLVLVVEAAIGVVLTLTGEGFNRLTN